MAEQPSRPSKRTHESGESAAVTKQKRVSACLHCRRQKLKCDGDLGRSCTRCVSDGVECIIKPRANAAVVADDLRWQQSVEGRFQDLQHDVASLRAIVDALQLQPMSSPSHINMPEMDDAFRMSAVEIRQSKFAVPDALGPVRAALKPAFDEMESANKPSVSIDEATILWGYFYENLAVYHGFVAGVGIDPPSPVLLAAICSSSASRCSPMLDVSVDAWLDFFDRALSRMLAKSTDCTWDDVVGLCIARTWFWRADTATAGLIFGCCMAVLNARREAPQFQDESEALRCRRVWDFVQITVVSQDILHLDPTIIPDQPPPAIPARTPVHVLFGALVELFDILSTVNRSLTPAQGLVEQLLSGDLGVVPHTPIKNYAQLAVLKSSRMELDNWGIKWLTAIKETRSDQLPAGRSKSFLTDLVSLYQLASQTLIHSYLSRHAEVHFRQYAHQMLDSLVNTWAHSLTYWPLWLLQCALIAALAVPQDDILVGKSAELLKSVSYLLDSTGTKLLDRLREKVRKGTSATPSSVQQISVGLGDIMPSFDATYTGSDAFWSDLQNVFLPPLVTGDQGMLSDAWMTTPTVWGNSQT